MYINIRFRSREKYTDGLIQWFFYKHRKMSELVIYCYVANQYEALRLHSEHLMIVHSFCACGSILVAWVWLRASWGWSHRKAPSGLDWQAFKLPLLAGGEGLGPCPLALFMGSLSSELPLRQTGREWSWAWSLSYLYCNYPCVIF